jgi:RNA polymerase subunit RPABC4/transcription elongation factor Spt4
LWAGLGIEVLPLALLLDGHHVRPVFRVCRHQVRRRCLNSTVEPRRYDCRMCYSAQIVDAWRGYIWLYGPKISLIEFAGLYGFRLGDQSIKIPKAVDAAFDSMVTTWE